jgi:SAM-dependent methyltransferase
MNQASQCCDICGSDRWEVVLRHDGASVCSGRELIEGRGPLVKRMCQVCGLVHTAQSPLDDDLDGYYRTIYSSKLKTEDYDYVNFALGKRFGQAVNEFVLAHQFPADGRLLDVGCGKGFFEEAFAAAYPGWQLEGVDPSERSCALARARAPQARFHCRKFDGGDYPIASYDLVAMHTVLNRVSPRKFISEGVALLKPGGMLSVAVAILPEAPFELYFADHHYMFSAEHLLALAEELGLAVETREEVGSIWRYLFRQTTQPSHACRAALQAAAPQLRKQAMDIVAAWNTLFADIRARVERGQRIALYGAGTTALIVLSQTDIPAGQFVGLYDDNPHKRGESFLGHEVKAVDEAVHGADAVVLCAGPSGAAAMLGKGVVPRDRALLLRYDSPCCETLSK